MEAARKFETQEREINLLSKRAWGKKKGIQKKKLLDTPHESNIY